VATQTAGETPGAILDPDGYRVVVVGLAPRAVEPNGTVTFNDLAVGDHPVTLDGLQVNCTTPENPVDVTVVAGATAQVSFPVTCWAPTTGRIAFSASVRGVWEIYTINPDGTDLRRLTTIDIWPGLPWNPGHIWPAWSPDGWKIAYTLVEGGEDQDIYVINADGTGQTRLTTVAGRDNYPAWSPDGSKIAFSSDRDQLGVLNIYVMNADGTDQVRLTEGSHNERPTWSPDGSKILFSSIRDYAWEVYMMNPDGTGQVRLTDRPDGEAWLSGPNACSPDGSRVLFTSAPEGSWDAYVMNADGTGQTRLTDWEGSEEPAAWSPDGTQILFTSTKTNLIYYMNADGTGVTSVSQAVDGGSMWPDWSHGSGALSAPRRASSIPGR
jgi:TolB protein